MQTIKWKLFLNSELAVVYDLICTSEGRQKFWAEKASEEGRFIHFTFPNGQTYKSQIIKKIPLQEFHLIYFDSLVIFFLESSIKGGTELTLINENVPDNAFVEMNAGWVSVLMNLKAVADFQCDLRNHDVTKTWDEGYLNN